MAERKNRKTSTTKGSSKKKTSRVIKKQTKTEVQRKAKTKTDKIISHHAQAEHDSKQATNQKKLIKVKMTSLKNIGRFIIAIIVPIIVTYILVDYAVQYFNHGYTALRINNKRISRSEYNKTFDSLTYAQMQQLKQTVVDEITKTEALQELAQEYQITVTEDDYKEQLDKIIKNVGGEEKFQETLKQLGLTEDVLKSQIYNEIIINKLVEKTFKYTEDDLRAFYDQYKDIINQNAKDRDKLTFEGQKAQIEEIYKQNMGRQQVESLIQDKIRELNVEDNVTTPYIYKFLGTTRQIIQQISEKIKQTKDQDKKAQENKNTSDNQPADN